MEKFDEKKEIEDGILEYEEEINEQNNQKLAKLDEIINFSLETVLLECSEYEKKLLFDRFLKTKPKSCLQNLEYFGTLPDSYQEVIYKAIIKLGFNYAGYDFKKVLENIFQVFENISNKNLSDIVILNGSNFFNLIVKNKSKLPNVSDEEILELLHYHKSIGGSKEWFDYSTLASYIDLFPNFDKNEVIEKIFTQTHNQNLGTIFRNRQKFGLSEREAIDIFYKRGALYRLLDYSCVNEISEEYHQEIAEKCIEEGHAWQVLNNIHNLSGLSIKSLVDKIISISAPEKGSKKTGIELLVEYLPKLNKEWIERIPTDILDLALDQNLEGVINNIEKFKNQNLCFKIINKLFEKKEFTTLLHKRELLGINIQTYPDFALKVIQNLNDEFFTTNQNQIKELLREFNINLEFVFNNLNIELKNKFITIENLIPGFIKKASSSFEIFTSVLQLTAEEIDGLKNNQNLLKSFEENPTMAVKLLIQYPKFDESPKENIDFVLEAKQMILKKKTNINSNSHEFRLLIQKQLESYRRNADMIRHMKEEEVDTDQWLNYDEEVLFELGGEESSYAELIRLPSERILHTLKKYVDVIRNTLSPHKKELLTKEVSLVDVSELESKIRQMEQLVQESVGSGNNGKAQGIQKGIEGLRKQIENPKKVPAWLKIMSDIDTVSKLFAKVMDINTNIAELDTELAALAQDTHKESQKKMFENKQKIKDKSEEFVSILQTTSLRLDSLMLSIEKSLTQTLGEGVSKDAISTLDTYLGEDKEHFDSDKTTLENVLKLNESNDDVKGSLIKIKVWDRNPDIDLYMGNYTDCCVRIDSDFHGSESPISDYVTDLGIQIVAVYDEKTRKPFAAAWCFVGEDKKGNKAFVIDNIEATGSYMLYKDDIQKRLKVYIEEYAKASGLKTISQGPNHNDMIVTVNIEEQYTKLGGYNTEGYYLEAEPDDEEDDVGGEYYVNDNFEQEELDRVEEERLINEYARTQENIVSMEEAFGRVKNS